MTLVKLHFSVKIIKKPWVPPAAACSGSSFCCIYDFFFPNLEFLVATTMNNNYKKGLCGLRAERGRVGLPDDVNIQVFCSCKAHEDVSKEDAFLPDGPKGVSLFS